MMKVLIAYASRKGSTAETAEFFGGVLRDHELDVVVADADDVTDVTGYDAFILGTGIYKGEWLPAILTFIRKFKVDLGQKPIFAWMLCIRLLEDDGRTHIMDNYIPYHMFSDLNLVDAKPFLGKLKMVDVDFKERWTLGLHYDGNLDPSEVNEDYRDWDVMREWAESIAVRLQEVAK